MNHNLAAKDFFSMMRKTHALKYRFRNPSLHATTGDLIRMWQKLNRGAP